MNDMEIKILRDRIAKERDPVIVACAVIGSMAGIVAHYADRELAVCALRQIADEIELAHKAAERRVKAGAGKATG